MAVSPANFLITTVAAKPQISPSRVFYGFLICLAKLSAIIFATQHGRRKEKWFKSGQENIYSERG
jgi:hypothetical protein